MKTIAIVFGIVAGVAVNCITAVRISDVVNDASIRLFGMKQGKLLGEINLSQANVFSATRSTAVLGRLWGLPVGKYFGAVYSSIGRCDQPGKVLQTYDTDIYGHRPLILFFDEIADRNGREVVNSVRDVSLSSKEKNNIINHTVLIYRVGWDQWGPLNSYLQPGGPFAVACGTVTPGLIKPDVFEIPPAPIPK